MILHIKACSMLSSDKIIFTDPQPRKLEMPGKYKREYRWFSEPYCKPQGVLLSDRVDDMGCFQDLIWKNPGTQSTKFG